MPSCPICGAPTGSGQRFCVRCGTTLANSSERSVDLAPPPAGTIHGSPAPAAASHEVKSRATTSPTRDDVAVSQAARVDDPPTRGDQMVAAPETNRSFRRARKPRTRYLAAILAVAVGGGIGGAVAVLHHDPVTSGVHNLTFSSSTTLPKATRSTSVAVLARSQAEALNALLLRSAGARRSIGPAIDDVLSCRYLARDYATLAHAAQTRYALLPALAAEPVGALPGGSRLRSDLRHALQVSAKADAFYAAWAHDEEGGCTPRGTSTNSNLQQAELANLEAARAKAKVAADWNPLARRYGLLLLTKAPASGAWNF